MCFVNGCGTPVWVPPDKAVSEKEREREDKTKSKVGGGEIERLTTGKTDGERKDECSGAERGLRWRSEMRGREDDVRTERKTAGEMKEGEINR